MAASNVDLVCYINVWYAEALGRDGSELRMALCRTHDDVLVHLPVRRGKSSNMLVSFNNRYAKLLPTAAAKDVKVLELKLAYSLLHALTGNSHYDIGFANAIVKREPEAVKDRVRNFNCHDREADDVGSRRN